MHTYTFLCKHIIYYIFQKMEVVGLNFKKLCTPAFVYFMISMFTIIVMIIQNMSNFNVYCLGDYSCNTTNVFFIYLLKIIYVLFWTWILNIICKSGATWVSWFLVIFPYILLFIFIFLFMMDV